VNVQHLVLGAGINSRPVIIPQRNARRRAAHRRQQQKSPAKWPGFFVFGWRPSQLIVLVSMTGAFQESSCGGNKFPQNSALSPKK
jgi:hypothetical protein